MTAGKWINFTIFNARSVRNKTTCIQDLVIEKHYDILGLTETWLNEKDESDITSSLTPNGYKFYHKPRCGKHGGGVGVLIRSNIKVKQVQCKKYNTFEHMEIILGFHSKSVRLVVLYKPPTSSSNTISDFLDEFGDYLSQLSVLPESLLILGDFNIHLDKLCSLDTTTFNSLLEVNHIVLMAQFSTHKCYHWLDLMLVKKDDIFSKPQPYDPGLSDHVVVMCKLFIPKPEPVVETRLIRNKKDINQQKLTEDLPQ